jgi:hypothetical protein
MDADRSLKHDLAEHLRAAGWLTVTEVQVPGTGDGGMDGRVDVAAVKPHVYARKDLRAYEVKGVRSDFQRDVASQKWRRYLQVFHRVYFAVPAGLVRVEDVPDDAGLIVRGQKGWSTMKAARGHVPPGLTSDAVLALLYRGYEEYGAYRDLRTRMTFGPEGEVEDCRTWGHKVARRLRENKHELEEPLRALLGVVTDFAGELEQFDSWNVVNLSGRLRDMLKALQEFERNGDLLAAIGRYLEDLRGRYGSADNLQARGQALLASLGEVCSAVPSGNRTRGLGGRGQVKRHDP